MVPDVRSIQPWEYTTSAPNAFFDMLADFSLVFLFDFRLIVEIENLGWCIKKTETVLVKGEVREDGAAVANGGGIWTVSAGVNFDAGRHKTAVDVGAGEGGS